MSRVDLAVDVELLPLLPGARRYADEWLFPAGTERNRSYYTPYLRMEREMPEELVRLLLTPETSGGLLVAVPPAGLEAFTATLAAEGGRAWTIGEAHPGEGLIHLR